MEIETIGSGSSLSGNIGIWGRYLLIHYSILLSSLILRIIAMWSACFSLRNDLILSIIFFHRYWGLGSIDLNLFQILPLEIIHFVKEQLNLIPAISLHPEYWPLKLHILCNATWRTFVKISQHHHALISYYIIDLFHHLLNQILLLALGKFQSTPEHFLFFLVSHGFTSKIIILLPEHFDNMVLLLQIILC